MRKWYYRLCENVAADCQHMPDTAVMHKYGVTRGFVRYWGEKGRDPTFHSGELGGAHNVKFTLVEQMALELVLWDEVRRDPFQSNTAFARAMVTQTVLNVDRRCGVLFSSCLNVIVSVTWPPSSLGGSSARRRRATSTS